MCPRGNVVAMAWRNALIHNRTRQWTNNSSEGEFQSQPDWSSQTGNHKKFFNLMFRLHMEKWIYHLFWNVINNKSNTIVTMRITMRAHLICFYYACIICLEFMRWFSCKLTEQLWYMHVVRLPTKCNVAANGPKMLKLWLLLGVTPVNASIHKACLSRTFLQQSAELCPCWRGFPYFQQLII